jgi:hypothetical protein
VQFVDLGAELLGQIEIVRRQLVLGIVAAPDAAVAARNAPGAPWSDPAQIAAEAWYVASPNLTVA